MMNKVVALIGNPNCGKTTLFNLLTGTYQKTGNWTGVTIESKSGVYKKNKSTDVIDLPGIYSLNSKSKDERVVVDFLNKTSPDVIVNVVDGTNIERNLYLTCELSNLKIPLVIAVNMADELEKSGAKLNEEYLSKLFGVPVIKISALKNINVDKLMEIAENIQQKPNVLSKQVFDVPEKVYSFIENNIDLIVVKKQTRLENFTQKADNILMHKIWGIPIFFCVITLVYFLSTVIGGFLGEIVKQVFDAITLFVRQELTNVYGVPDFMVGLVCDAIIKGIGTVSSFLPQIMVLFALLTLIEQSGYSSRIAFNLDRIFKCFGLGGKSIIPLTLSCGCTVTGIMSTRMIESASERRMTIFLAPFMPCGAKMAVFGWFSTIFFGGNALISSTMYFVSIICTAVSGVILKRFKAFKDECGSFILEMPTLRPPVIKDLLYVLWEKFKDFATKAGTVIFLVSVVLWVMQNFGVHGYTNGQVENSFLYSIGNMIKFVFLPLGFDSWQASVSILSSLFAKEAVVETICLLTDDPSTLFGSMYSVYAFMAFVLLSPPCIASIATAKRELSSKKWLLSMILFHFFMAYIVAFIINVMGFIFKSAIGLILCVIIAIIIILLFVRGVKRLRIKKCAGCTACKKGELCQHIKRYTT